jgi:hypothetical protein
MAGKKKAATVKVKQTKQVTREAKTPTAGHVPCPLCGAKAGERCVSPNGARWTGGHSHKARVEAAEATKPKAKASPKRTRKAKATTKVEA